MATLSASNNGNGTATVTASGTASPATWLRITNTTTGVLIWSNAYTVGPQSVTDQYASPGTNNYQAVFQQGNGGATVGTLTTSAYVTWPTGSLTATGSGPYTGCYWSIPDDNNIAYSLVGVTVEYAISGGALQQYGGANAFGLSGNIGDPLYVGYSTSVAWEAIATWSASGRPNAVTIINNNITTDSPPPPPPPPPAAPNPPTNLVITSDTGSAITLAWTASAGGATGYEVRRSINGGAWSTLVDQGGTGYTDSAVGTTRPVTYQVFAYNSSAGGTTYSSGVSVSTQAADSCGVLVG